MRLLSWVSVALTFAVVLTTSDPARGASPIPVNAIGSAGAVLPTGGWSHSIGIDMPEGPNGQMPGIAIVADHRTADGPLGVGWRLEGFSRIERRSAHNGVPALDATDIYSIDGMPLHPDASTAATNDYRAEKDDNRVFVLTTSSNRWDVYRDGWMWRYGEYALGDQYRGACATETREQTPSDPCDATVGDALGDYVATTAWLLSRLADPSGNETRFTYTSNAALDPTTDLFHGEYAYQHVPAKVAWAGDTLAVKFVWLVRPDARVEARSGRLRMLPGRLDAVQVEARAGTTWSAVARYELVYLDEATEACDGAELPDAGIDRAAATVLHRVIRTSGTLSRTHA